MKKGWNKKLFSSLNVNNGKSSTYGSKGVLRQYDYWLDQTLGPGILSNKNNSMHFPCLHNNTI